MGSELVKAALSAAQSLSTKEAIDLFCEQIAQQKPAWKIARELWELHYSTLQVMEVSCAAYALAIGTTVEELTQTQKRTAMLNWVLGDEKSQDA